MRVVGWSRSLTHEEADRLGVIYAQTPLEVARAVGRGVGQRGRERRDQAPGRTRSSWRRCGRARISSTRRAASVVDEAALEQAVREKKIRAGLDVFADEPAGGTGAFANPIVQAPGVYGTHHVGASTDQAQVAIAHEVIRIVQTFRDHRRGAQRGEPARAELGDARAVHPPPEPARRAGARVRRAGRRRDQRGRGREHHLSRRAGHAGADSPRRRARRAPRSSGSGPATPTSSAWS